MQVIVANIFAASMTAAVIVFPSPYAAVEAVRSVFAPALEERVVPPTPILVDEQTRVQLASAASDDESLYRRLVECMAVVENAPLGEVEVCAATVHAFLAAVGPFDTAALTSEPVLDPEQEAVVLASAHLCRRAWADSAPGRIEGVASTACLNDVLRLAET